MSFIPNGEGDFIIAETSISWTYYAFLAQGYWEGLRILTPSFPENRTPQREENRPAMPLVSIPLIEKYGNSMKRYEVPSFDVRKNLYKEGQ